MLPPNFYAQNGPAAAKNSARGARGASDFLRANDKMAAILPGVTKMVALQKACATNLPAMFELCEVLQFESAQLVLSTPNAALASKLKQQLPKLQETLLTQGWQVNSIRLKVQVARAIPKPARIIPPELPAIATSAFAALGAALENSPRNQALKEAIKAIVQRRVPPSIKNRPRNTP
jgi:hypothetical protein